MRQVKPSPKPKRRYVFFYVFRTTENKSHTLLLSYTGQRGYYYSTEAFEEYIEEKGNTLREYFAEPSKMEIIYKNM